LYDKLIRDTLVEHEAEDVRDQLRGKRGSQRNDAGEFSAGVVGAVASEEPKVFGKATLVVEVFRSKAPILDELLGEVSDFCVECGALRRGVLVVTVEIVTCCEVGLSYRYPA
jgi:hypothetical protein